ncbi:MAG TPA: hypothetical protein VMM93_01525 [Vicinamibacterales bacterium]|nr:hypothetical protein [Vicinamibacterales bacterium]
MTDRPAEQPIEHVQSKGRTLAYVVRTWYAPERTTFPTPSDLPLQLGFVVYAAGSEIARHVHTPIERHLRGTSEVLIVKNGRCWIDIYDDDRELVVSRELRTGDIMLMVGGGHGFRMIEDTTLVEVKQGPYTGLDEKERF